MQRMHRVEQRAVALLIVLGIVLTGCTSTKPKATPTSPKATPASPTTQTTAPVQGISTLGIKVSGKFGVAPTITVPDKAAPTALTQQILSPGAGATLAKGDTLVANYVGQTWAPQNGKINVFDSSFTHGSPAAFVIGSGRVIPGWDKTLVGVKVGSRVLLTVPPVDGYGTAGQPSVGITGTSTLIFVIDLITAYTPNASAAGTVVSPLPSSGLPKITNVPGKKPNILSVAGVKIPAKPVSTLVVTGSGAKIDATKTLVMQLVRADLVTGKNNHATWGQGPQTVAAQGVLGVADALTGQNVGSRVIVLLPASPATPATATQAAQPAAAAEVLIVDVVGQF